MRNKWSRLLALLMTVTIVFNTFSGTAFATETGEAGTVVSSESETAASETDSEAEVETEAEAETEAETETSTEEDTEGSTEASAEESTEGVTEEATTEETTETATEENAVDETEASGEDASQASTEASAEESSADVTEESTETSAEESSANATEETGTEAEEESSEDAAQESAEESSEAATEESTAEITTQVGDIAASETLGAAGGAALLTGAVAGAAETYATGDTIYVLAGSDFQPTDASNTTGVNLLNQILDKVDDKYTTMDGFLFAGDYDYNYANSTAGKNALQAAVQAVYGAGMDEVYVEGNHDNPDEGSNPDMVANGTLSPGGANDTDNYGVYVIHESDYMWRNDDETTIKNTASNLEAYLNAKRNAGYTKPIFVVSHLPLHYCMRTQVGGGDGKHANYIFDVLNEAGAAGLNIIFMFGHNHSHGWDDPYGGAAIFLKKGDSINIAQNSTTNYNVETLKFTYMNAGYVSYYRNVNSGAETDLSMTVFAITDSDVTIERYTADGLHDLKSAGVANTHASTGSSVDGSCSTNHGGTETYSPNTTTVASAYTLTLNTEITPAGTEVEAPDSGSTSTERTYTRVTSLDQLVSGGQYLIIENGDTDYFMLPESISNSAGDRVGYNIESTTVAGGDTITGDYSAKEWTMTGSGASWVLSTSAGSAYMEYQSNSRAYGRISATNSSTFTIGGSADAYTFSTTTNGYTYVFDHSSAGLINGYVKAPETTFYIYRLSDEGSAPTVGTTGGSWITITKPTEAGTKYVYELDTDGVDTGVEYLIVANSYEKALSAAASSNNAVDIEISGNYAYADSDTYGWTFTLQYSDSNNVVYYIRLNNAYLRVSNGSLGSRNDTNRDSRWTVTSNGDGSYDVVRSDYNLRWSNSNGVFQVSSSNEGPVRLYKYVRTETTTAQPGLYGMISGELTYNVAIGTSAADAVAAVKAGIDILYHTGDESTAQTFPDDGEGMTWTLDPSYDGTTPGEYAVTIAYKGVTLGVAKVVVPSVSIKSYTVDPMSSTVRQGASQSLDTGSDIIVTLENGDYYTVPVTISMLSKDGEAVSTAEAGTLTGLTVTYNGVVVAENYTLNVVEKVLNDYPEYPDEGAVKVNKTATGIDFQSSGIAQVELSASGVPAQKGADVVIVIDTSSSMDKDIDGDTPSSGEKSRIQILSESLEQMLLQFQKQDDSGVYPDIDIAIIDFNGYANRIDGASLNNTYRDNEDLAEVYTGNTGYISEVGLSAANFVDNLSIDAAELAAMFNEDRTSSGTNYDSGLDNAYKLLSMKKEANGDEERDQYVIFLSDGAPFRYNGYENDGSSGYNNWDKWLRGYWVDQAALETDIPNDGTNNVYPYFYNGNGNNHPHRIAEAIKGTEGAVFDVVINTATYTDPAYIQQYSGMGAQIYSIGFGLAEDGDGVDSDKGSVVVSTMQNVLQAISSGDGYYYDVDAADELTTAFTQIATAINYAASNARFVDQLGSSFDLQMVPFVDLDGIALDANGDGVQDRPIIEIKSYEIYSSAEVGTVINGVEVTEDMVGDRKGAYSILERIVFNDDGTKAYSSAIDKDGDGIYGFTEVTDTNGTITSYVFDEADNIMTAITDDTGAVTGYLITAFTFWYHTNPTAVEIQTSADGMYSLTSETFYWNMSTIRTTELALSYYVYLSGSMEGTKQAGSYGTNNFATLYYDNYLGNACQIETVSPTVAWKSANVSYAFYLVNEDGKIIVNQTTGQTGTFANKIEVTSPVVYKEILLNNLGTVNSINVASAADDILPKGYTLYDDAATYTIEIDSDSTGEWAIVQGSGREASTYVTQFNPSNASAYSNALFENTNGYDYTHTVVWFAVVWEPKAMPDTVVIDYGLPVDISVLGNDLFGDYGTLAAIGSVNSVPNATYTTALADGFSADDFVGSFGVASINGSKVQYELNTSNGMQINNVEQLAYAVNYKGTANAGYYYGIVNILPATTVYYEDSYVSMTTYSALDADGNVVTDSTTGKKVYTTTSGWPSVGAGVVGAVQDEDRPGQYSLPAYDANSIYGSDKTYAAMSLYSLGSAAMVHVDANNYGIAEFEFYGTGFDVISLTSNETGVLVVQVYDEAGTRVKAFTVNTYYGYTCEYYYVTSEYAEDGTWVETSRGEKQTTKPADYLITAEPENPTVGQTYSRWEAVWVTTPDVDQALYQIPVMKVAGLTYGKYTVKLSALYYSGFDSTTETGYDLYLDAIRIYDPIPTNTAMNMGTSDTSDDTTVGNIYVLDGEGWPLYKEVRNKVISAASFGKYSVDSDNDGDIDTLDDPMTGVVFIDGDATVGNAQMSDYISYGPNNELYLDAGQSVAFKLNLEKYYTRDTSNNITENIVAGVRIGLKSANGQSVDYVISNISKTTGVVYNADRQTMATTTDMYYDITDYQYDIIVITNISGGVLSLTNLKVTFTEDPSGTNTSEEESSEGDSSGTGSESESSGAEDSTIYMTERATFMTLRALNSAATVEPPEEEITEEETTVEETTEEETAEEEIIVEETTEEDAIEGETTADETVEENIEIGDPSYEDNVEEVFSETFEPERVSINVGSNSIKVGRILLITVQTDSDVAALTINGKAVAKYIENRWTGTRTWIMPVKASNVGTMSIEVVAYNAEGVGSEAVVEMVTVTTNSQGILNKIFGLKKY